MLRDLGERDHRQHAGFRRGSSCRHHWHRVKVLRQLSDPAMHTARTWQPVIHHAALPTRMLVIHGKAGLTEPRLSPSPRAAVADGRAALSWCARSCDETAPFSWLNLHRIRKFLCENQRKPASCCNALGETAVRNAAGTGWLRYDIDGDFANITFAKPSSRV
jgi:hypothetical protein